MRPPTNPELAPDDASRVRLALLVSHEHPLYRLAEAIDWARFEAELGPLYAEDVGRPGLPTRLMVGLHYLKYLFDESGRVGRREVGREPLLAVLLRPHLLRA